MNALLVPLVLALTGGYALARGTDVFPVFLRGAADGLRTAARLLPTMLALLTAVTMLRASGFIDLAGQAMQPLLALAGIPPDCAPLVLLKPLSGSGGLALGQEIMRTCGVDSEAGRAAAVMLGASETSLYTIGIYCGHLRLKRTGYVVPAALLADLVAFVCAARCVRWLG